MARKRPDKDQPPLALTESFDAGAALESAAESIVITEAELTAPGPRIVYVNRAFERVTGWTKADILGKSPRVLQGPKTDKSIFADLATLLRAGKSWENRAVNYRRDGSEFILEWSITSLPGRDGVVRHYISVQRDVTKRVEMEQRMIEALKAAHAVDEAKLDFLAIMSHELRTPLNAVIGFSELMASEVKGPLGQPVYRDYAGFIRDSACELLTHVTKILDYVRSANPEIPLDETPCDLAAVIGQCVVLLGPKAEKADVAIAVEGASGVWVRADRQRLQQIILNLLSNAVNFSPREELVRVELRHGRDEFAIAVIDKGPGIPKAIRERLFEPFKQPNAPLARVSEGLGLGLAIAARFARLHGGRIEIDSEPGRGTTARLVLPLTRRLMVTSGWSAQGA